ncbi:MAG: hypothetical protein U5N86_08360 [Planctomycetota bacterium]|nr:hypothetical protein [Planctomycetota bacterium]
MLYEALSGDTNTNFEKDSTDANSYLTFDDDALMTDVSGTKQPQMRWRSVRQSHRDTGRCPRLPQQGKALTTFGEWAATEPLARGFAEMGSEENDINNWR